MVHSVRAAGLAVTALFTGILLPAANGQCVGPGPGEMIPTSNGSAGYWPVPLPSSPCPSGQWIDVPVGATHLTGVILYDLFHTALGEVQILLHSPSV